MFIRSTDMKALPSRLALVQQNQPKMLTVSGYTTAAGQRKGSSLLHPPTGTPIPYWAFQRRKTACCHTGRPQIAAHLRPYTLFRRCRASDAASQPDSDQADRKTPREEQDFDFLSNKIADLTVELKEELKGCSIYLVGMMGSGKSTVSIAHCRFLRHTWRLCSPSLVKSTWRKRA
jgi:hypothetical protein